MDRFTRLAHFLIRTAALEDRIQHLAGKYPMVPYPTIAAMAQADPGRGSNLEWLVRQVRSRRLRWPEDQSRAVAALSAYLRLKRSPRLLREQGASPDLNAYNFNTLEDLTHPLQGLELQTGRETIQEQKSAGTKDIYNTPPYRVIQVGGEGTDPQAAVQAACTYARGTRWCTGAPAVAERYLTISPLYIIIQDGRKVAQYHPGNGQLKGLDDRELPQSLKAQLLQLIEKVGLPSPEVGMIENADAYELYNYAKETGQRLPARAEESMKEIPFIYDMYLRLFNPVPRQRVKIQE